MRRWIKPLALALLAAAPAAARAGSADPQVMTDHPWYPGELACSTFPRLFNTQAILYQRVTGKPVATDEDKALASWYWRNLHYWHGEEGKCDLFGQGFNKSDSNREYWGGLFAHGYALCGTTHAQWNAEMDALLGHCRSRTLGVAGHNSFEVFLTGGAYGAGRWVLLDHDISTVIFSPDGKRLLGIDEIKQQLKTLTDPQYKPDRQRGWRVSGLHDQDAVGVYSSYNSAEYLAGYAGPPPIVDLRAGESLRRYLQPGLDDGQTFVFWGRNPRSGSVTGPERDRTWVNQPEKMFNSRNGTGSAAGRARYANAVFTYTPDFASASYKQAVVSEDDKQVTFAFRSPYVIAATPANDKPWGIYDPGATNGLRVSGRNLRADITVSTDGGKTWKPGKRSSGTPSNVVDGRVVHGPTSDFYDLTDEVKGQYGYLLRVAAAPGDLKLTGLTVRTVCQANVTTIPHLRDGTNTVTFESSGQSLVSAGPTQPLAEAYVVDGKMGSPTVTLELAPRPGSKAVHLYAAGWQSSGAPPNEKVKYNIDWSADGGKTWAPAVKDWQVLRRPVEPADFWSQSLTWGDVALPAVQGPVRVRFTNTGGKQFRKVEAHLACTDPTPSPTQVTFAWKSSGDAKTATHTYPAGMYGKQDTTWTLDAGPKPETQWVEYSAK